MTLADRIVVMHDRRIEQVGTPMEIYHRPASRFVASFVGSPAMNFVDVSHVSGAGGSTAVDTAGLGRIEAAFRLPATFGADGASVGIRAEDTRIAQDGEAGAVLAVEVVERLGDKTLVYGTLSDGTRFAVEADGRNPVRSRDRIRIAVDPKAVHLFGRDGRAHHAEDR